jgi:MoaA/NifB/PqqE/SkfB family radical SAM enzyme
VLHFLGGEPLGEQDFLEVASFALSKDLKIEVTTNGTFHDPHNIVFLLINCHNTHVSLDGATAQSNDRIRGTGTFQEVLKFFELWNEYKSLSPRHRLDIAFTATKESIGEAKQLVTLAMEVGANSITVQPLKVLGAAKLTVRRIGITHEEYFDFGESLAKYSVGNPININFTGGSQRYKEYIRWKYYTDIVSVSSGCDSGTGQLRITSTGELQPCIMGSIITKQYRDSWTSPSGDIASTYRSPEFQGIMAGFHRLNEKRFPPICSACEHRLSQTCHPGCSVQGRVFGPSQLCEILELKQEMIHGGS